jgi:aldehyde:ferredoxin oxidoreductase
LYSGNRFVFSSRASHICSRVTREGFTRKDDVIPSWWRATEVPYPDATGTPALLKDYWGKVVTRDRLEKMLDHYYDERGWDVESGIPT